MNEPIQHIAVQYWERVTQGEPQEDIVRCLRENGYHTLESIVTIRMLLNMGLREARVLVETHPAWQKEKEALPAFPREVWPSWNDIEVARKNRAVFLQCLMKSYAFRDSAAIASASVMRDAA